MKKRLGIKATYRSIKEDSSGTSGILQEQIAASCLAGNSPIYNFVYETGAVDAGRGAIIDKKVVEKERKRRYKISRTDSTTGPDTLLTQGSLDQKHL